MGLDQFLGQGTWNLWQNNPEIGQDDAKSKSFANHFVGQDNPAKGHPSLYAESGSSLAREFL